MGEREELPLVIAFPCFYWLVLPQLWSGSPGQGILAKHGYYNNFQKIITLVNCLAL